MLSPTASYVVVIASYPQEERVPNQKRKNPQEKREIGSRGLLRKRREKREGKGVISGVEEDETYLSRSLAQWRITSFDVNGEEESAREYTEKKRARAK